MVACQAVFNTWDDMMKEFTAIARDREFLRSVLPPDAIPDLTSSFFPPCSVTRKRSEKFIQIKIVAAHHTLQERLSYLRGFRKQHEQLRVMTGPTKGLKGVGGDALTDIDMEEEVKIAFESVKNIDVLDVTVGKSRFRSPLGCVSFSISHPLSHSSGGTEIWVTAETAYNERVARVENQIIARLRDRLGTARNANEMFRVFSKFNTLLVRQKVRRYLSIPSPLLSR